MISEDKKFILELLCDYQDYHEYDELPFNDSYYDYDKDGSISCSTLDAKRVN